ncbi:MAG: hypothetical protein AB2A00_26900 [Myxococcota bacterium]
MTAPAQAHRPVPVEDGEKVIRYDIDVLEDDSRCGASEPYKRSQEEMVVEWHTLREITIYLRGGLYQGDAHLDENGHFERSGQGGPCRVGSTFKGRLDKQGGEGEILCRKRDCDVIITFTGQRMVPRADAGAASGVEPEEPIFNVDTDGGFPVLPVDISLAQRSWPELVALWGTGQLDGEEEQPEEAGQ